MKTHQSVSVQYFSPTQGRVVIVGLYGASHTEFFSLDQRDALLRTFVDCLLRESVNLK